MQVSLVIEEIKKLLDEINKGAGRVEMEKAGITIKAYKVGDVIRVDIKQPK